MVSSFPTSSSFTSTAPIDDSSAATPTPTPLLPGEAPTGVGSSASGWWKASRSTCAASATRISEHPWTSIGPSFNALQIIQDNLGVLEDLQGFLDEEYLLMFDVEIATEDGQVLILLLRFRHDVLTIIYYLVYDAKDASLYMIPYISGRIQATFTMSPVLARPAGGRGHELVLAVCGVFFPLNDELDRLCVCTSATRENAAPDGTDLWKMRVLRFPERPGPFSVDVKFSVGDKVFWADLSQGVAYSDLRQGGSAEDFVFIKLPDGCQADFQGLPAKMSRTMACVQGSIKFVCIGHGVTPPGNKMVKVWTLDLDGREWNEDKSLTCPWEELWMKACTMNARLKGMQRPLEPRYPVLMSDGVLCLLLPKTRHKRGVRVKKPDYICSFDMLNKS
ncbi:hypothetical protein C2845_PM01G29280 [Panicum miliaceum]|uniref:DUF1618 domain-containing protein n=1 Tax=Panicum miliaceum TaxID=4540 RepID=A0A3L6TNR3_PANMI|nr:hypothetical protein C2845_PM01G29280 [Panicum miliaceum]